MLHILGIFLYVVLLVVLVALGFRIVKFAIKKLAPEGMDPEALNLIYTIIGFAVLIILLIVILPALGIQPPDWLK